MSRQDNIAEMIAEIVFANTNQKTLHIVHTRETEGETKETNHVFFKDGQSVSFTAETQKP